MNIKLVIFDFDNTLYHGTLFALRLVLSNLRRALWAKAERKARKLLAGKDYANGTDLHAALFDEMSKILGTEPKAIKDWYETKYLNSMVSILNKHYAARPLAKETIDKLLKSGIKVAVLSDYGLTDRRLEAIGLADDRIGKWSTEDIGALKPAARTFAEVAQANRATPQETLVIGDRADTDGAGAKNAEMSCWLIDGKKAMNSMGIETLTWEEICTRLGNMAERKRT